MGPPQADEKMIITSGALSATSLSGIFTDTALLTAYDFGNFKTGDSGNPNFVLLNNKLCLAMVNLAAGKISSSSSYLNTTDSVVKFEGPDYTNADTHVVLQSAVDLIGNTESYKISAVDMV
jgi:hypothetical protein